jgi:hypothetical protein
MDDHRWANVILKGVTKNGAQRLVLAVNHETQANRANRADVIVACSQILAQNITAEPSIAAEIRTGIMTLIDGYAMEVATLV